MLAVIEIKQVALHIVGFTFKTDVSVCLVCVTMQTKSHYPFDDIPQVKEDVQHFTLLCCVYAFMPDVCVCHIHAFADE